MVEYSLCFAFVSSSRRTCFRTIFLLLYLEFFPPSSIPLYLTPSIPLFAFQSHPISGPQGNSCYCAGPLQIVQESHLHVEHWRQN